MAIAALNPEYLLSMPSGMEWLWIVLVIIILFGGKKIPELAKGLGKGIREFNDAKDGIKKEIENGMKPPPSAPDANAATEKQNA
ncbi:MAG: twin-arginine translocase TatA/TatE family subunit [Edaphocola sp.]